MIRFPNRYHASETPGASQIGVEPCWGETDPKDSRRGYQKHYQQGLRDGVRPIKPKPQPFDFAALEKALGR